MSGMVKVPVVTIFAILEPDMRPVNPLDITAAFAGPPLNLPKSDRARVVKN